MESVKEAVAKLLSLADEGGDAYLWNDLISEYPDGLDLQGADLSDRYFDGYNFTKCNLTGCNLDKCSLQGAIFENATLSGATFNEADLRGANLKHAQAPRAEFNRALMQNADLSWAFLKDAQMDQVDLAQVQLWKTDLRGVNFPPFEKGKDQDYLGDVKVEETRRRVLFPVLLRQLGAQIGTPYRWTGTTDLPQIEMPKSSDDPKRYLDRVLIELGLRKIPHRGATGEIEFYEVTE